MIAAALSLRFATQTLALLAVAAASPANGTYEERLISWALEQQGRELEPAPEGKQIEELLVSTEEVFVQGDFLPTFLNVFHWKTKDRLILQEVLLQPGDTWSPLKVAETERNLRRLSIFSAARVVTVKGRGGGVALLVVARDRWSLRLNNDFNLVGALLQYLRLQLIEENLFGRNQKAAIDFELRLDTVSLGQTFQERRILGSRLSIAETASLVFNRATGALEGTAGQVVFGRPLVSLDQQWAFRLDGAWNVKKRRVFRGASIYQLPYPSADAQTGTVPYVYDSRDIGALASVTRSLGTLWKLDTTGAIGGYTRRYAAPAGTLSAEQEAWLIANYLPRTEDATYLYAGATFFRAEYKVLRNVDAFALSEDYQLGPRVFLGARYAVPLFLKTHFVELGAAARYRLLIHEDLLTLSVAASTRVVPGVGSVDEHVAWEVANVSPPFEGGRFVARIVVDIKGNDLSNRRVLLGGGNGLRGAAPEALVGKNYFLGNVEYRTRAFEFRSAHVGFVLFYDFGRTWPAAPSVTHTLGVGARVLLPQFNQEVIRLDLGFVLGEPSRLSIDRFSATFGQATDLRPAFLDSPL